MSKTNPDNSYLFKAAYTKQGWVSPAYLQTNSENEIVHVTEHATDTAEHMDFSDSFLIPGFVNAHSHAFQYAMAGLSENHQGSKSNFWSWREQMYDLVDSLSPESLYKVTKNAYENLIQHGYTNVVEFHYLHKQPDGSPYENHDLSVAVLEAAKATGIKLTFAPVLYQQSYYDKPPEGHQKRFVYKDLEKFMRYFESCQSMVNTAGHGMAIAAHSMRSVKLDSLKKILSVSNVPIHVHCAEQKNETIDFVARFSTTPAAWLNNNCQLNINHNFVHCTHFTRSDLQIFAQRNANIVLCPTTEANLGDGIFPLTEFHKLGGRWCIGTDSHVGVSPVEELRWAEYVQRLVHKKRNLIVAPHQETGEFLYRHSLENGLRSAGVEGFLEQGTPFNGIVLKSRLEGQDAISKEQLLSKIIFSDAYRKLLTATIINGRWHSIDEKQN